MATTQKDFKVKNGIVAGSKIQTAVPSTTIAPLNIPHGNAPTTPVNGDMWSTTAGFYVQVNGATVGPLGGAGPSTFNSISTVSGAATAATLWSDVTTGSIAIGAGLTTGALNLATVGTGATPISIGHTNATIGITGNTTITGTLTITGNLDTNLTTAGVVTTNASGVLSSSTLLPIANGGTNSSATPTNGGVAYGTGTAYAFTTAGTSGQALVSAGAAAPVFTTLTLENLPGAFVKKSVRVATTGNIATLAGGAPSTVDGISLAVNDRILVKDQTTTAQNGIYIVQTLGTGANGTWVRAADADAIDEIASAIVSVDSGLTYGGFTYDNDLKTTDTLGTTGFIWNRVLDDGYSMNIGTTAVPIGRASGSLTLAGLVLTTPTIDGIVSSAGGATNALWAATTTGSITIGAGLTTGSLAIAAAGTGATPITLGHTNATLAVTSTGFNLTTAGALTLSSTIAATGLAGSLLSSANPVINGTAAPGTSAIPSRQDHVHPTDTTRAPLASPTFTGKVTTAASAVGGAGFNLPAGTAPTTPADGDMWTTTAGLFVRINGVTVGPLGGGGSSVTIADTAPGSPASGDMWWESDTAKLYVYYNDGTSSQWVEVNGGAVGPQGATGATGPMGNSMIPYQRAGVLTVDAGVSRFRFPVAATILGVSMACNTAPTGASIICDVNKNGTTIFTNQANRPTIAASAFATASEVTNMDVTSIAAGDYITVDVDQVGSTVAGADLTVLVRYQA